jgi:hypothetical protein
VKREQLEHVPRARIEDHPDPDVLVIGSQSILGRFPVDGAIGELPPFHENFGCYAQGVSVSTAVLPSG